MEISTSFAAAGSSPRVRGTVGIFIAEACEPGIIPACAGNSITASRTSTPYRDHPRVCGEQRNTGFSGGTQFGIIPACAGNRTSAHRLSRRSRDHPRVCGEQISAFETSRAFAGSSPRVRGTAAPSWSFLKVSGIIPACAGNRCRACPGGGSAWDHPRVCGEQ